MTKKTAAKKTTQPKTKKQDLSKLIMRAGTPDDVKQKPHTHRKEK